MSLSRSAFVGVCDEPSSSTFHCSCFSGWHGKRCELRVNYCANVTCLNGGVCRSSMLGYTCACPSDSYFGPFCEVTSKNVQIRKIVAKSIGFVGIGALIVTSAFVVVMDVLKYGFGIVPAHKDQKRRRRRNMRRQMHPPIYFRFVYVNAPEAIP